MFAPELSRLNLALQVLGKALVHPEHAGMLL